jgi:hypothetical protein
MLKKLLISVLKYHYQHKRAKLRQARLNYLLSDIYIGRGYKTTKQKLNSLIEFSETEEKFRELKERFSLLVLKEYSKFNYGENTRIDKKQASDLAERIFKSLFGNHEELRKKLSQRAFHDNVGKIHFVPKDAMKGMENTITDWFAEQKIVHSEGLSAVIKVTNDFMYMSTDDCSCVKYVLGKYLKLRRKPEHASAYESITAYL